MEMLLLTLVGLVACGLVGSLRRVLTQKRRAARLRIGDAPWLECLTRGASSASPFMRLRSSFIPGVECLGERVVPAGTFVWKGTQSSAWELAANWDATNANVPYPGADLQGGGQSTDDVVIFNNQATQGCDLTSNRTVKSLTLESNFATNRPLEVKNGKSLTVKGVQAGDQFKMEGGTLKLSGGASLNLEGDVAHVYKGGDLNSAGGLGTVYVYGDSLLAFYNDGTKLGANLVIGQDRAGNDSKGTVTFATAGANLNDQVTLYNNVNIINHKMGSIAFFQSQNSDLKGGIERTANSTSKIENYGRFERDQKDGANKYLKIAPPVEGLGADSLLYLGDESRIEFIHNYTMKGGGFYKSPKDSHIKGFTAENGVMKLLDPGAAGTYYTYIDDGLIMNGGSIVFEQPTSGASTVLVIGDSFQMNGGTLTVRYGQSFSAASVTQNGGTVSVSMDFSSSLTVAGSYTKSGGSLTLQSGSLSVGGDFTQSGGDTAVSMGGTFSLPDGTLSLEDGIFTVNGTVAVTGTLDQHGAALSIGSMGALNVTGAFTQTAGSTQIDSGSMTVTGSLQQSGGTFTLGNSWYGLTVTGTTTLSDAAVFTLLTGGTLYANGGLEIGSGATLRGWGGSINGNVSNAGTLTLINGSAGTWLNINGNYSQTGTLRVGLDSMMMNSHLSVWGLATLGGTLEVVLLNGFMPSPSGMPFSVLYYGSRSGTFATLNLPALNCGSWDPRYDDPYSTFSLWVVS
jgi:hypothetical protein